jgi:dienelactone hydrolase
MRAAIVLFPAIAGINSYIRRHAWQLGEAGFAVDVGNYCDGAAPPDLSSPDKIQPAGAALSDPDVLATAHAACEWLRARVDGSRTGAFGLWIGGT